SSSAATAPEPRGAGARTGCIGAVRARKSAAARGQRVRIRLGRRSACRPVRGERIELRRPATATGALHPGHVASAEPRRRPVRGEPPLPPLMASSLTPPEAPRHVLSATNPCQSIRNARPRGSADAPPRYDRPVAEEAGTLAEQLEEIRAQLAWVRDYL